MKTVYKFGYKLAKDKKEWAEVFKDLFDLDFNGMAIVDAYPNAEKNWYETFKIISLETSVITPEGLKLISIKPNFNRYQEMVYLMIVVEGDMISNPEPGFALFKEKAAQLSGFVDTFAIPFKECDLYAEDRKSDKYQESLVLANPVLISHDHEPGKSMVCVTGNLKIYYDYGYAQKNKKNYIRIFTQVYIVNNDEDLGEALDHFHSVFILFHRSWAFYNEVRTIDGPSKILAAISSKLNAIWPRERINLFLLSRFLNAGLYNRTFFGVLELNAQMNSILSQLKVKQQKLYDKYEKQYERVFYNFGEKDLGEVPYYKELKTYLYSPYHHRQKLISRIQAFFDPTDVQIERLRNDNDSKVNFSIQWIMSILSVIIFFWGVSTMWYENTVAINKSITDTFVNGIGFMPSYLLLLFAVTLGSMGGCVIYFLINNSSLVSRDLRRVMKDDGLDVTDLVGRVDQKREYIEGLSRWSRKKRLYLITEMFKMITTYVILHLDVGSDEAEAFMGVVEGLD